MQFALDMLNIHIPEISKSQWKFLLRGMEITERPILIFTCGNQQNCFTSEEKLKVAAIFVSIAIHIQKHNVFCCSTLKAFQHAIFLG